MSVSIDDGTGVITVPFVCCVCDNEGIICRTELKRKLQEISVDVLDNSEEVVTWSWYFLRCDLNILTDTFKYKSYLL